MIIEEIITNSKAFEPDCEKLYKYLKKHYPGAKYKACYEAGIVAGGISHWRQRD